MFGHGSKSKSKKNNGARDPFEAMGFGGMGFGGMGFGGFDDDDFG